MSLLILFSLKYISCYLLITPPCCFSLKPRPKVISCTLNLGQRSFPVSCRSVDQTRWSVQSAYTGHFLQNCCLFESTTSCRSVGHNHWYPISIYQSKLFRYLCQFWHNFLYINIWVNFWGKMAASCPMRNQHKSSEVTSCFLIWCYSHVLLDSLFTNKSKVLRSQTRHFYNRYSLWLLNVPMKDPHCSYGEFTKFFWWQTNFQGKSYLASS